MTAASEPLHDSIEPLLGVKHSLTGRLWRQRTYDERLALALSQRLDISDILARVLASRDVPLDRAAQHLEPKLRDWLPDPHDLCDMERAAQRIAHAMTRREKVTVFGDYDVDGATSSAVIKRYFDAAGVDLQIYIPDRQKEGYGPNTAALLNLAGQGVTLVITVDCGTMAYDPLDAARQAGLDIIVVDHHQAAGDLPKAYAIVNPRRHDDRSGQGHLAAVGVAFLLMVAVNRILRDAGWFDQSGIEAPNLLDLLDLVALGTLCDVVPLTGLNRAFVVQGLKVMNSWGNVGLKALADVAELTRAVGTYELGFVLGPRVNAGGRVGQSDLGATLLTSNQPDQAAKMALALNRYNEERRAIEAAVQQAAFEQIESHPEQFKDRSLLVVHGRSWHPGVIGIVASRLKSHYQRPVIVIAVDDKGLGRGSGRSIMGVDMGAAVAAADQHGLLVNGGGHAMAAGLTVERDKIGALAAFLEEALGPTIEQVRAVNELRLDGLVLPEAADFALVAELQRAGPFGSGNPEPLLAFPGVRVVHGQLVGQDHVRCVLAGDNNGRVNAIAFRSADRALGQTLLTRRGAPVHVAGYLRPDTWRGGEAVQFVIEDLALADP